MKIAIRYFLLFTVSSAFAESPFVRELTQAKALRDQALKAAAEPINRKYKEGLETVLRRATQANDLEAAIKIKEMIGKAADPVAKPKVKTAQELGDYLDGTVWEIHNGDPKAEVATP